MDKDRITGAAKDVAGKVEGAVGDLTGDSETRISGRAREATGGMQNLYGQAKDAVRDASDTAIGYAKDAIDNSGNTYRDGSRVIAEQVKENPLGALLIAGGIGFMLAMLLSRPAPPRRWR